MNQQILELLREAGLSRPIGWQDLVVVQNYAPVPPPPVHAGVWPWDRGLNFAVLDRGTPTHFCKCRPRGDASLLHETTARQCLAGGDTDGLRVLTAVSVAGSSVTLQVSRFLSGPHYGRIATRQRHAVFMRTSETVLMGAGTLSDRALRECPSLVETASDIQLSVAATECLEHLVCHLHLEPREQEAVHAVLAGAGSVAARPQHCDLWWRNVIVHGEDLWVIDLEDFGRVCVPLHDDLTFLIAALSIRGKRQIGGVEALCGDNPEGAACRLLLASRAASEGVDAHQLDGLLAYHVLKRASTVLYRGGPGHAAPHIQVARHVARRLGRGDRDLLAP